MGFSIIRSIVWLLLVPHMTDAQVVFQAPRIVAQIQNTDMPEASGLAASWLHEGLLWTHNDSGEGPYLHALSTAGDYLGGYHLGVKNTDLEDIAVGPGPEPELSYVYVGDIGNNDYGKPSRDSIRVHRLAEPPAPENGDTTRLNGDGVDTITLTYPSDEEYIDAETLMVDPTDGVIYIVRKTRIGNQSPIYATPEWTTSRTGSFSVELEYKGDIINTEWLSGGDISRDGSEILLKRYHLVFYWKRNGYATVADALLDQDYALQPYAREVQGEAICFDFKGNGYYTLSEANKFAEIPLLFYPRKPQTLKPTSAPTRVPTRSPTTPPPTLSPVTKRPTRHPTDAPSVSPTTASPTMSPTFQPSVSPTTLKPTTSTQDPTYMPTQQPTTLEPTFSPTTSEPTVEPTAGEDLTSPLLAAEREPLHPDNSNTKPAFANVWYLVSERNTTTSTATANGTILAFNDTEPSDGETNADENSDKDNSSAHVWYHITKVGNEGNTTKQGEGDF